MTKAQIVTFLRHNVNIQQSTVVDSEFLAMTDEQIELYLTVALTRDFASVVSLDYLPNKDIYPLVVLAKKELFFALATLKSNDYDLGADNNNYLKQSQRFEHYMKLVAECDKEYEEWKKNGGENGQVTVSHALLSNRYGTTYNYENGVVPVVSLYVTETTQSSISLQWAVNMSRFLNYRVYISDSPIVDEYSLDTPIASTATLVATIQDIHQNLCRLEGLESGKTYYVAVAAEECSTLTGYAQLAVTTTT